MLQFSAKQILLISTCLIVSACGGGSGYDQISNDMPASIFEEGSIDQTIQLNRRSVRSSDTGETWYDGVKLIKFDNDRQDLAFDEDLDVSNAFNYALEREVIQSKIMLEYWSVDGGQYTDNVPIIHGESYIAMPTVANASYSGSAMINWAEKDGRYYYIGADDELVGTSTVNLNFESGTGTVYANFSSLGLTYSGTIDEISADGTLRGAGRMSNEGVPYSRSHNSYGSMFGAGDSVGLITDTAYTEGNQNYGVKLGIAAAR